MDTITQITQIILIIGPVNPSEYGDGIRNECIIPCILVRHNINFLISTYVVTNIVWSSARVTMCVIGRQRGENSAALCENLNIQQ